jgi:hypothetical protein
MKNFENYFDDARRFANENFYSFDGFDDYDSFDDDYDNFDDYSADGGGQAPTSQPYIVNVENTNTASNISNVTILGAYSALATSAPAYGNTTTAGISITMGISNISYVEFLYQTMNKPYTVGLSYLTASGTNADAQVLATLTVTQKDVNGNIASKVLTPTIDPYQYQTSKIAFKYEYRVDGFTYITLATVYAATTATLYLYPSETVSTSRALAGRQAVQNYANPQVTRGNTIKLQAPKGRGMGMRRMGR